MDFNLLQFGKVIVGICVAIRDLPLYEIKMIRTGQYTFDKGRTWEGILYPITQIRYTGRMSTKKPEGTPWDDGSNIILEKNGSLVSFDSLQKANKIELSLDNNDYYLFVFYNADREVHRIEVGPTPVPGGGLIVHNISINNNDTIYFNSIRIAPVKGDNAYSLGHIKPIIE